MLTIYKTSELYQEIQKENWKEENEIEKLIELKTLVENLTINTRIVFKRISCESATFVKSKGLFMIGIKMLR